MKRILLCMLFMWSMLAHVVAEDITGHWFAQLNFEDSDVVALFEFNLLDSENCVITSTWSSESMNEHVTEVGQAKYQYLSDQLLIIFNSDDEVIRTEHIFDRINVFDVSFEGNKMYIYDKPSFAVFPMVFGRGYANRGFNLITE